MGLLTATFRDNSDELSRMTVRVDDQDGADVWTVVTGLGSALETILENISIATLVSINYSQGAIAEDDTRPASLLAQRESGLRVFYQDAVNGEKGNITIAAPDLTALKTAGTDEADLSVTETAALVSWMESNVLSKAGNAITVTKGVFVGRNN